MSIKEYLKKNRNQHLGALNYRTILIRQGYPNVLLGNEGHKNWKEVHRWCKEQYGEDHYTWTGSRFWFETEQDATWFAMRWA